MRTATPKKWRRVNPYQCRACSKKRLTFKFDRATDGLCTKCKKYVDEQGENQGKLFD